MTSLQELRAFVQKQVRRPEFWATFTGRLLPESRNASFPFLYALNQAKDGTYYLNKPCKPRDRIKVSAWWSRKEVMVCKDSYQPEARDFVQNGAKHYCEGMSAGQGTVQSTCGCGKLLLRCGPEAELKKLQEAFSRELSDTLHYVAVERHPFEEILTGETVRSAYGDFFYHRAVFHQSGTWPGALPVSSGVSGAKPRQRPEGFAAGGILSSFHYIYLDASLRLAVQKWATDFFCLRQTSAMVDPEVLFDTPHVPNGRVAPLWYLAEKVPCSNCHARLEQGVALLSSYGSLVDQSHYQQRPELLPKELSLYVRHADDKRKSGPPTLTWYAHAISEQPEFMACMSQRTQDFFYPSGLSTAKSETITASFRKHRDIVRLMDDIVVAIFDEGPP